MPQVRCPNCGTLNQVAVGGAAVQVACYACRTVFPASFSDGATPPAGTAVLPPTAPSGYPAGNYSPAPPAPASGPMPPHLAGNSASGPAAPQAAAATIGGLTPATATYVSEPAVPPPEKASGLLMVLVVAATMFIALGSVVLVALLAVGGKLSVRDTPVNPPADQRAAAHWSDAPNKTLEIDDIRVRIDRAEWDVVRGRDRHGKIITSSDKYLSIIVNVRNLSRSDCLYESWHEGPYPAVLTDEDGRQFEPFCVPRFESIEWHVAEETIERNLQTDDRLVFILPSEVNHDLADAFLLDLPAAAVGREGAYRFRLPVEMIEGF